ncbi:MAG: hypothetical protein WC788_02485 [Candidatus Paceibacterota bacterium]
MKPRKLPKRKDNEYLLNAIVFFVVALVLIILYVGGYIGRIPKAVPEKEADPLEEMMKTVNAPDDGIKKEIPKELIDSVTAPEKVPDPNETELSSKERERKIQELIDSTTSAQK